jgi:predicted dehydrogenase
MHATTWLFKPPAYFDAEWRKEKGAGPLGINIVHDVDLMCFMAGPVRHALAMTSRATRQFEVEDTAAVILEFESGALGTLNLSDTIVAPWSYELTAGENPAYPMTAESSYLIGGTHGALDIPKARFWHNPEQRGWWENIESQPLDVTREDPLRRQIDHFCDVITGAAQPRVTGYDGLAAVATLEAIARSAASGARESVER